MYWSAFPPLLRELYHNNTEEEGRPNIPIITMVKILFLQSLYNLSDQRAEKETHDRISFMNFLDYPDTLPDSKTIWFFKERLPRTGRDRIIWTELQRHLDSRGTKIRTWYPPEDHDPTILQEPNRKGISVFGAVRTGNGKLLTGITGKYNAMTFPDSVIVLDNALYHHANIVAECAFLTGVDLLFMPPYSPELNSIKRVRKLLKKLRLHNQYFPDLKGVIRVVAKQFLLWNGESGTFRTLCYHGMIEYMRHYLFGMYNNQEVGTLRLDFDS